MKVLSSEKGYTLLVVLVICVLLILFLSAFTAMAYNQKKQVTHTDKQFVATAVAEMGSEFTHKKIEQIVLQATQDYKKCEQNIGLLGFIVESLLQTKKAECRSKADIAIYNGIYGLKDQVKTVEAASGFQILTVTEFVPAKEATSSSSSQKYRGFSLKIRGYEDGISSNTVLSTSAKHRDITLSVVVPYQTGWTELTTVEKLITSLLGAQDGVLSSILSSPLNLVKDTVNLRPNEVLPSTVKANKDGLLSLSPHYMYDVGSTEEALLPLVSNTLTHISVVTKNNLTVTDNLNLQHSLLVSDILKIQDSLITGNGAQNKAKLELGNTLVIANTLDLSSLSKEKLSLSNNTTVCLMNPITDSTTNLNAKILVDKTSKVFIRGLGSTGFQQIILNGNIQEVKNLTKDDFENGCKDFSASQVRIDDIKYH